MKLRKMLAWLTAMAMLGTAALATGCGSEETSSSKAETSAAETEEAADAADDAEVDELAEDDAESGSVDDETAAYADALAGCFSRSFLFFLQTSICLQFSKLQSLLFLFLSLILAPVFFFALTYFYR